jgi:uncharacterized protein YgbK (DUF1537 family)
MSDLLLSWVGDDFTGSTDVLEALTLAGVPAALFLEPPTPAQLAAFPGLRAAGVAGTSRTMSPEQMDRALPPAFEALRRLGAPVCHYKLCSTFDSSPSIGSIGRAITLGRRAFDAPWVPLVVGAPQLRRYTAFGNLFATMDGVTWRIDRHPVMSRHPITPMDEGDLRVHLAKQTALPVALLDLLALGAADVDRRLESLLRSNPAIVLFDVVDLAQQETAGRLIWSAKTPFVAGSSGIEYALTAHWRREGLIPGRAELRPPGPAERLLVVSGSCSAVTERQIEWALRNGFAGLRVEDGADEAALASKALDAARSAPGLVLYSALGPGDPGIRDARSNGEDVGLRLGRLATSLLERGGFRRLAVAGGDTSGRVARELGLSSLEMLVPIAPGSPLCRGRGRGAADGLEVVLKGGQVGQEDFFGAVLRGAA